MAREEFYWESRSWVITGAAADRASMSSRASLEHLQIEVVAALLLRVAS